MNRKTLDLLMEAAKLYQEGQLSSPQGGALSALNVAKDRIVMELEGRLPETEIGGIPVIVDPTMPDELVAIRGTSGNHHFFVEENMPYECPFSAHSLRWCNYRCREAK